MSVAFASFIFLIEEVQNVFLHYKECKLIQALRKKQDNYEKLSSDEKRDVRNFFDTKVIRLDAAQNLICRESSFQVALQLTLILYQENFQRYSSAFYVNYIPDC